jgi:hypothetical protein
LLTFTRQESVVDRTLLDIAEDAIGGHDLPEQQRGIGVAGVQVGMVRLHGLAESFLDCVVIGVGPNTKQAIERILARLSAEKKRQGTPAE